MTTVSCLLADACKVVGDLRDNGKSSYSIAATSANLASVRLLAFGTAFDVPLTCAKCPTLASIAIEPAQVVNLQQAKGVVRLSGRAPANGTVIYPGSDLARVPNVPASVTVPPGKTQVTFPITVFHVHEASQTVTIEGSYGGKRTRARITVSEPEPDPKKPVRPATLKKHDHSHPD
ncbi:MAG: hypothetical protein QOH21_162 [Acidobacteriota bacterium]|nr:hypothetical protein [Acidobacteriota bacterium]